MIAITNGQEQTDDACHIGAPVIMAYLPKTTKISHGLLQGSILGLLLCLIYINDLPVILDNNSIPVLFRDNTSVLISNTDNNLQLNISAVFEQLNRWFTSNLLSLNYDKTTNMHSQTSYLRVIINVVLWILTLTFLE